MTCTKTAEVAWLAQSYIVSQVWVRTELHKFDAHLSASCRSSPHQGRLTILWGHSKKCSNKGVQRNGKTSGLSSNHHTCSLVARLMVAPSSTSLMQTSMWPFLAATINAVSSGLVGRPGQGWPPYIRCQPNRASTFCPAATVLLTAATSPEHAALIKS